MIILTSFFYVFVSLRISLASRIGMFDLVLLPIDYLARLPLFSCSKDMYCCFWDNLNPRIIFKHLYIQPTLTIQTVMPFRLMKTHSTMVIGTILLVEGEQIFHSRGIDEKSKISKNISLICIIEEVI